MIIATGSCSKKFGDICYTFVIFSTNISDFIVERLLHWLSDKEYPLYFFLVVLVNCSLHIICVYVLVGSRIHLLMTDPNFDASSSTSSTTDATQFIALRTKIRSISIIKKISTLVSSSNKSNNSQMKSGENTINSFKFKEPSVHVL